MRYFVGCWTFLDKDKPLETRAHWLDLDGTPRLGDIDDAPTAVYYGALDPSGESLILLHNDMHRSAMSRQAIGAGGALTEAGRWSSGGEGGSYIAFDATGRYFAVANSATGWTVFRNDDTPAPIAHLSHEGSGPHPRQAHSHPHCVIFSPDNRWLYCADMGADVVLAFPFDAQTGTIGPKLVAFRTASGDGPRHLLFHRGRCYLLNELGNTLVVLRPEADGTLTEIETLATLPDGFTEFSHCAHLAVGGDDDLLLASNRGHDSIVAFMLADDGRVADRNWTPSGGIWPWFFLVRPNGDLIVANGRSDNLALLSPSGGGSFELTGHIDVPHPVFVAAV